MLCAVRQCFRNKKCGAFHHKAVEERYGRKPNSFRLHYDDDCWLMCWKSSTIQPCHPWREYCCNSRFPLRLWIRRLVFWKQVYTNAPPKNIIHSDSVWMRKNRSRVAPVPQIVSNINSGETPDTTRAGVICAINKLCLLRQTYVRPRCNNWVDFVVMAPFETVLQLQLAKFNTVRIRDFLQEA